MRSILLFTCFFWSMSFAQQLVSSKLLPCNNYAEDIYKERISSQRLSHDTLYLEIDVKRNCSAVIKSELTVNGDSLFINLNDVSEIYSACNCCYSMQFIISGAVDTTYRLFIDQKELTFSKSKYIDFPPVQIPKTLFKNETNASGNKIGYWWIEGKNKNHYICFYGDGSSNNNEPLWGKSFYRNKLTSVMVLTDEGGHVFEKNRYEYILKQIEAEEQATKATIR